MGNICKGKCPKYKFERNGGNENLYINGARRCQTCNDGMFIKWDGHFCPCCGTRLRTRPRKSKLKQRVLKVQKINAY